MKKKRASNEDEEDTEQPLSGSEPEPSAGKNSEPDDGEDAQQPAAEGSDKRRELQKKLKKLKETYETRGIVYLSRIPPHLKPQKLRHMLSQHGEISRLYLAPEDASARKRRKKIGKNSGKNFTEGWVEFEDKRVAKQVAQMLNGQPMGGKRRSAYHYDLWCLKYLSKFKWDHLTEEIAYQKAVREQRLATEISAAKRERDFYMSRVAKAKATSAQKERKLKRQLREGGEAVTADAAAAGAESHNTKGETAADRQLKEGGEAGTAEAAAAGTETQAPKQRLLRTFGQKRAKADPVSEQAPSLAPDVLALIAGKK